MIKGLLAAVAAGAIAIIGAPNAAAITNAENTYLNDLAGYGITGDPNGLIADGWTICKALGSGTTAAELAQAYQTNAKNLTYLQALGAVNSAKADLCP